MKIGSELSEIERLADSESICVEIPAYTRLICVDDVLKKKMINRSFVGKERHSCLSHKFTSTFESD